MFQTTSAPAPEPIASPTPAGRDVITSPPDPQPGAVPVPAPVVEVAEPTPTVTTPEPAPEPTAVPEATVAATPDPVDTTAGVIPEPTQPSAASFPEPTVTSAQVETATPTAAPVPEPTQQVLAEATVAPQTTSASMSDAITPNPTAAVETPVEKLSATPSSAAKVEIAGSGAVSETVEPQNSLTQKFTEAEWAALKELRAKLPDTFAEAFADNENARSTPITIWGVTIDPNNPKADARVSVVLMKFLRARNLSIPDTRDKLVGTLRWRESFNVEGALKEDFPQDVFGSLAHISGTDKEGRLVVYNIYGGNQDLKSVFGDVQRFIRWRVALMERSVMQLDFTELDQMIQVHDYEGVSLTSRDANSKAAASEATNIFQSHYPEMLYKKFFINVPTLLNWMFWLFKPLVSANTLAKMTVVGTGQHAIKKALSEYITVNQIPGRYGGEGEVF